MKLNIYLLIGLLTACNGKNTNITPDQHTDSTHTSTKINSEEYQAEININTGYSFDIEKIDSIEFVSLHKQLYKPSYTEKITNTDSVQSLLKGIVDFQLQEDESLMPIKIHARNGEVINLDDNLEGVFIAYFPKYDFLLLEGGHSSDYGYSLTTGETIFTVGNPDNQTISPNQKFRISGIYGGQECVTYIIQKFTAENSLIKIGTIDDIDLCYFRSHFWRDDTTFYYSTLSYTSNKEGGEMQYYRLNIKKRE